MTTTTDNQSNRQDWMFFLISTLIMFLLLIFADSWFWVAMPFSLTYLVKALNVM